MTDKAIIQGSLVDVRNVNQHKCVRMLIDVPAEHAPMVMEAFGWPTMASPVPVAIARLQSRQATQQAEKTRRPWGEVPRSQQAGIACADIHFLNFLQDHYGSVNDPVEFVHQHCGITSRADLQRDPIAADQWDKLYSDYQLWRRGAAA